MGTAAAGAVVVVVVACGNPGWSLIALRFFATAALTAARSVLRTATVAVYPTVLLNSVFVILMTVPPPTAWPAPSRMVTGELSTIVPGSLPSGRPLTGVVSGGGVKAL